MEPYCGIYTHLPETGLGQGPGVVLGLAEQAVPPECTFVHDNLFTSLNLIDEMTKHVYRSIGTLKQCRLPDIPFTGVKDYEKMHPGSTEVLTEGEKLLVLEIIRDRSSYRQRFSTAGWKNFTPLSAEDSPQPDWVHKLE
ncbi:hypothetical protein L3Q82_005841 [Scortum barcoo]|uniref:Uncharacterized protein n=1 Tax=Scortum barcoo TaxID=214431 RepID=A0ACB8V6Y4_9TELE|nr:hypothetical protein L3Q82_005841 [Scortum barcoo]